MYLGFQDIWPIQPIYSSSIQPLKFQHVPKVYHFVSTMFQRTNSSWQLTHGPTTTTTWGIPFFKVRKGFTNIHNIYTYILDGSLCFHEHVLCPNQVEQTVLFQKRSNRIEGVLVDFAIPDIYLKWWKWKMRFQGLSQTTVFHLILLISLAWA